MPLDAATSASLNPKSDVICPPSATHGLTAAAGVVGLFAGLAILLSRLIVLDAVRAGLFLVLMIAIFIFSVDVLINGVSRRSSTGLDLKALNPSERRLQVKLLGLVTSVGFVAFLYYLFPEYYGDFYARYFDAIRLTAPIFVICAIPYFWWIDRHQVSPEDGYWHVGMLALFRFDEVRIDIVAQHMLGWIIKGFFVPLMFIYMCNYLDDIFALSPRMFNDFKSFYDYSYTTLYFTDVCFTVAGYVFALRLFDTHFRSAEPTLLGWVSALVCYQPFWSVIGTSYLAYDPGRPWGEISSGNSLLYTLWGSAILFLILIYVWATVSFGCRFSNLSHRGIITNGPYRFTKHPAYVAKNLSWWLISVPFLSGGGFEAVRHCLLLLLLNGVYTLRAWTEERHLSRDPTYVAYARWIEENGMFRWLAPARWLRGRRLVSA